MQKCVHRSWPAILLCGGLCLGTVVAAPAVGAAEDQRPAVENRQVGEALTQAKKLASQKQWDGAMAALKKAQQVPDKSAYADYKIDEFMAYVLTQQRKYAPAGALFEKLAASPQASSEQKTAHLRTAAQLYLQASQNQKAAAAAQRALQREPSDAKLLELAGQAEYMARNYKGAASTMQRLVSITEKQGKKPQESWLQIILNSYYKLNEQKGIENAWVSLLRHYPKPEYWAKVLDLKTAGDQPEPLELGYQRLTFELGLLKDPRDYEDLAMSSIDLGAPAAAVQVLREGLESGKLAGSGEARFKRMLEHAEKAVAANQAKLDSIAQAARNADSGEPSVKLGRAYLGQAQYDEAINALRTGIEKGELENPSMARVELGIAYLKNDQMKQAQQSFAAVERNSEWRELADLWALHARPVVRD